MKEKEAILSYISNLQCTAIEDLLKPRWLEQSSNIIRLNLEAMVETSENESSVVETICQEKKLQLEEAIACLLENMLFFESLAVDSDFLILDIIDWSCRQLTQLCNEMAVSGVPAHFKNWGPAGNKDSKSTSVWDDVQKDNERIQLVLGLRSVAIILFSAIHRQKLPLCATSRLLQVQDVPILCTNLLDKSPWIAYSQDGIKYVFKDGHWQVPTQSDSVLQRQECQLLFTLHSLLVNKQPSEFYEINNFRQSSFLKIRNKLNEAALQQFPDLEPMFRWLASLAMCIPHSGKMPPVITTVNQLGESPYVQWIDRWDKLAVVMISRIQSSTQDENISIASYMSKAWDLDVLESLLPDVPPCAVCGSPAGKRCSRCRSQWYCRRECQVEHWSHHKSLCDVICRYSNFNSENKGEEKLAVKNPKLVHEDLN